MNVPWRYGARPPVRPAPDPPGARSPEAPRQDPAHGAPGPVPHGSRWSRPRWGRGPARV